MTQMGVTADGINHRAETVFPCSFYQRVCDLFPKMVGISMVPPPEVLEALENLRIRAAEWAKASL